MSRRGTFLLLGALMLFAVPAGAHAAVWTEGTVASPFQLADSGGLTISVGTNRDPGALHAP